MSTTKHNHHRFQLAPRTLQLATGRRGVLLLVVLSMLVLFLMLGTAFVIATKQSSQAARSLKRAYEAAASPMRQDDLLEEVLGQLLRDTNNQNSSLRYHSLLRDMYGTDGFSGEVWRVEVEDKHPNFRAITAKYAGAIPSRLPFELQGTTGGQIVEFAIYNPTPPPSNPGAEHPEMPRNLAGNPLPRPLDENDILKLLPPTQLNQVSGYYNGRLLTWLTGPAAGQSTRILGYRYDSSLDSDNDGESGPGTGILQVMAFKRADGQNLTPTSINDPDLKTRKRSPEIKELGHEANNELNGGERFVINGAPFNGMGAGYNPGASGARLSATETLPGGVETELALTPNGAFFDSDQVNVTDNYNYYHSNDWTNLKEKQRETRLMRLVSSLGIVGQGGSDESYDAVDYQNMFLGLLPPHPVETVLPDINETTNPTNPTNPTSLSGTLPDTGASAAVPLPSFHRPALLYYWANHEDFNGTPGDLSTSTLGANPATVAMLRKILLRPNWVDHPDFTGSNPDFAATPGDHNKLRRMIYGPWDVDNDNDGVRDSVWIDFGAPAFKRPDGKMVKPLAAILCLDLDGRLNLNAHGSIDLADHANLDSPKFNMPFATNSPSRFQMGLGQGYGPPDISLNSVLTEPVDPNIPPPFPYPSRFDEILVGELNDSNSYTREYPGRYGSRETDKLPGRLNRFGLLAQIKLQGMPRRFDGSTRSAFTTPPDMFARYAMGINDLGQPVHEAKADSSTDLDQNSPYELDLSRSNAAGKQTNSDDAPFTVGELERLLRAYDVDAGSLSPRLWELAGQFKSDTTTTPNTDELNQWRTLLTTDSHDLPVPSVLAPTWMYYGPDQAPGKAGQDDNGDGIIDNDSEILWWPDHSVPRNNDDLNEATLTEPDFLGKPPVSLTIVDLLRFRIKRDPANLDPNPVPNETQIAQLVAKLLSPDLLDGQRMDINRPLGNGRDDNNNGVVDEPGEMGIAPAWKADDNRLADIGPDNLGGLPPELKSFSNAKFMAYDFDQDGKITYIEDLQARQLLARHLYVLAMTLANPLPAPTQDKDKAARARRLAQWAINVVDFRDPDNCMTPFEYDPNPFDGWDPAIDGVPGIDTNNDGVSDTDYAASDSQQLVWGCERPELLITETMAWHDRRTTDETGATEISNMQGDKTETSALVTDPPKHPPDLDYDQLHRPRGAAFIELYNPWPANPSANKDTHAIVAGQDMGVYLAAADQETGTSPVWRLAIYQRPVNTDAVDCASWDPDAPDQADRPTTRMDRCVYFVKVEPDDDDNLQHPLHALDSEDGVEFLTTLIVPTVRPGRYLVVGSGEEQNEEGRKIKDGTGIYVSEIGDPIPLNGGKEPRRIVLNPHRISIPPTNNRSPFIFSEPTIPTDQPGQELTYVDPEDDTRVICDVAVINRALSSVNGTSLRRRFTLTEPAIGYPGDDLKLVDRGGVSEFKLVPGEEIYPNIPDKYNILDYYNDDPDEEGWYGSEIKQQAYDTPLDDNRFGDGEIRLHLTQIDPIKRIVECYSMIYLQRLANPLRSFNKFTNPYRTIDSMSANVTVFNGPLRDKQYLGELRRPNPQQEGDWQRYDNNDPRTQERFASLQRGYASSQISQIRGTDYRSDVMSQEPPSALDSDDEHTDEELMSFGMQTVPLSGMSLLTDVTHTFDAIPDFTLGYLNHPWQPAGGTDGLTPKEPFSWLTWNNRPYTGGSELMLVPRSRSSQLLREFSGQRNPINPYDAREVENKPTDDEPGYVSQRLQGAYGHLPNMFLSSTPAAAVLPDVPAGLFRLLEYLQVPSRFVGTETWLNPGTPPNPNDLANNPGTLFGGVLDSNIIADSRQNRQPPYNRISAYRDPGRVNLNTIWHGDIWDGGIMQRQLKQSAWPWDPWKVSANPPQPDDPPRNNYVQTIGHDGPLYVDVNYDSGLPMVGLLESRRGYEAVDDLGTLDPLRTDQLLALDPNVPTFFANPFRSPDAGNLVPLPQLRRQGVDCGLVRSDKVPKLTRPDGQPITADPKNVVKELSPSAQSLLVGQSTEPFRDAERNAFFHYQPLTRLANLATTRSNVFAVWVTIGFFEVEELQDDVHTTILERFGTNKGTLADARQDPLFQKVYPEGYLFGKEAGSETGDIHRLREFAIIDRTIPVAFEPGQEHNSRKAVRLRRRIE